MTRLRRAPDEDVGHSGPRIERASWSGCFAGAADVLVGHRAQRGYGAVA